MSNYFLCLPLRNTVSASNIQSFAIQHDLVCTDPNVTLAIISGKSVPYLVSKLYPIILQIPPVSLDLKGLCCVGPTGSNIKRRLKDVPIHRPPSGQFIVNVSPSSFHLENLKSTIFSKTDIGITAKVTQSYITIGDSKGKLKSQPDLWRTMIQHDSSNINFGSQIVNEVWLCVLGPENKLTTGLYRIAHVFSLGGDNDGAGGSSMVNLSRTTAHVHLELGVTRTWGNRTLDVYSREWRQLRQKVLEKYNYACSFCGISSSKHMICDHINGDASDNSFSNLRINCPACDSVRHCGLSGIKKWLQIRISYMDQIEIIHKTQEYLRKYARMPSPEEVDPQCQMPALYEVTTRSGEIVKSFQSGTPEACVAIANILLEYDRVQLKGIDKLKGFFTQEGIVRFEYMKYIFNTNSAKRERW